MWNGKMFQHDTLKQGWFCLKTIFKEPSNFFWFYTYLNLFASKCFCKISSGNIRQSVGNYSWNIADIKVKWATKETAAFAYSALATAGGKKMTKKARPRFMDFITFSIAAEMFYVHCRMKMYSNTHQAFWHLSFLNIKSDLASAPAAGANKLTQSSLLVCFILSFEKIKAEAIGTRRWERERLRFYKVHDLRCRSSLFQFQPVELGRNHCLLPTLLGANYLLKISLQCICPLLKGSDRYPA